MIEEGRVVQKNIHAEMEEIKCPQVDMETANNFYIPFL